MSWKICRAACAVQTDMLFLLAVKEGQSGYHGFYGHVRQSLEEVKVSNVGLWRDGGSFEADTSLGKLSVSVKSTNAKPGYLGNVPVKILTGEEMSALYLYEKDGKFKVQQSEPSLEPKP